MMAEVVVDPKVVVLSVMLPPPRLRVPPATFMAPVDENPEALVSTSVPPSMEVGNA